MSPDSVLLVNAQSQIIFANSEAEKKFGYHREEMVGESINMLVPERFRADHPVLCEKYFFAPQKRRMRSLHLDAWGRRKNQEEFPVQITLAPLKSERGLMAMTTVRDLTARRMTEMALRTSEQKYRKLVEAANDAIFVIDSESEVISEANKKAEQLLKMPYKHIIGMRLTDLFPPEEAQRCSDMFTDFSREGQGVAAGVCIRNSDGRNIPVQISAATLEVDGRKMMQGIFRDVSEAKLTEEILANRVRQQAIVAYIGQQALVETDIDALMNMITERVAWTLDIEYCKVLELLPGGEALLLRAGIGWKPGYVGRATVTSDVRSQAGYTLLSDKPIIVDDLKTETRFQGPPLLTEHDVVSGMSVIIRGEKKPFGVLGAHTKAHRIFTGDDANFLQAIANVLAGAIDRRQAEEALLTKDREIRQTYVDVFFAVTGGKLVLVSEDELAENLGSPVGEAFNIYSYEELGGARATLRETISAEFPDKLNLEEVVTATGEAMTNAVKHSGGGEVHLFRTDDTLQIVVGDSGQGIDFSLLPKATLMAGFSTKQTLGIGFTIMLEFCDRLLLSTRPGNTTVVLEITGKRTEEEPADKRSSVAHHA